MKVFPLSGRHLDQRAGPILGERFFQPADGFDLHVPKPRGDQGRHVPQIGPQLVIAQFDEPLKFVGPMEREHIPAARVGIEAIGEPGFNPGGFIRKRQRQPNVRNRIGQTRRVFGRLRFHARQRVPCGFGLDHAGGFAIQIKQIIREAAFQGKFAYRNPHAGGKIHRRVILYMPTALGELAIDFGSGFFFWIHN